MKSIAFPEPLWVDAAPRVETERRRLGWGFLELFVVAQTFLPALLYFPVLQPLRLPIRIGAFAASLAALVAARWAIRRKQHPSTAWLLCCLSTLMLMVFHPNTNTYLAGFAQAMLYLAVMAPAFWAPALAKSAAQVKRMLALLLVLNGINAAVGVLQVYDPRTWMPSELTAQDWSGVVQIRTVSTFGAKVLSYKGRDGESIIRPPGLFDSPGAVAGPGMFAGVIGLIFFVSASRFWQRLVALFFAAMGVSVIYLTQVRTSFVVLLGMLAVYVWAMLVQRRLRQAVTVLNVAVVLLMGAFSFALFLGGESIRDRFATLWSENPAQVYYASRGEQLEKGFTSFLVEYPFGAGLARWGMMRHYFGNPWNLNSPPIWAEVQFPAWILDGGFLLPLLYSAAVFVSLRQAFHLMRAGSSPEVRSVAALILTVNSGTAALMFSFTPFTTQLGLQFWLLSGVLHGLSTLPPAAPNQEPVRA